MVWPTWLWIGTPLKFSLWLMNRIATSTGVLYLWRRLRSRRHFWAWFVLVNTVSLGLLVLLFFWIHQRASGEAGVSPPAQARTHGRLPAARDPGEPVDRNPAL